MATAPIRAQDGRPSASPTVGHPTPAQNDPTHSLTDPVSEIAVNDPLLDCLEHLVHHHERATARAALISGLPLEDGCLTPKLFPDAAARAGLSSKVVKRNLKQLHRLILPAILILKSGGCAVLHRQYRRKADVFIPDSGKGLQSVKLKDLRSEYSGYAILVKPDYQPKTVDEPQRVKRQRSWFWGTVVQFWPSYVQVFIAAAFVNVLGIAAPLFIMNVYDRVLPNKALTTLWVLAIGIVAAIVFDFIFKSLRNALIGQVGQRADIRLASRLFEHILKIEGTGRPAHTGEFANKIRDYETVREFFTSNTVVTLTDLAFVGLYIFIIYQIAGIVAVVPAVALALVFIIGLALQYPLARTVKAAQTDASKRHAILFEAINGIDTIKTNRAEGQMQRDWEQFVAHNAKTAHQLRSLSTFGLNLTGLVQQLVSVAIVVIGVHQFDEGNITPGALIAAVILAGRGVAPLGQLASTMARAQQAFQALKTLNQIMAMPEEGGDQVRHVDKTISKGSIEFDHLSFSYPEAAMPALNDISLKINEGERIGIIGKIGSGKTTIGRLLTRLYVPSSGNLLLDGVDVRQYHPAEIRRQIAFVAQDSMLFSGTVRDNITLGAPQTSDNAVFRAAQLAGVDAFINGHPQGINMQVGEGGKLLSSGQRHAIALARAFLLEPAIIFLDEPTGLMDLASERVFVNKLTNALSPNQTLLLATHRQRPLALVDRLIVIDNGRILADGPKNEILSRMESKKESGGAAQNLRRAGS
ncbi:MAG: type I secretion system permease/ATPase [Hyphomicrobiaceae bacterium]